ncbi:MAG TPA: SpoIIE family protein phosphatase [Vicinamibacterales bacterium]|nr:SpoIIE family protein phosphatase [Vicinamibacterales bacterium]
MALASNPRVLVADDQPDVIAALRLLLRGAGLDADSATSVQDVRDRLNDHAYDLLLMDLNYARDTTSGAEGLDLLTEVHTRDRHLPIVVMTGWGSIDTAVEAMRRGARAFVPKPWENAMLTQTIQREVSEGRALRRADAYAARELEDAQLIQRGLLPASMPTLDGCEMAAVWRPASAFGGDCYDALSFSNTRAAISIGDVAGKGLPAALLMSNLQASVRAFASDEATPAEVVERANRALCRHTPLDRFVTFFYGVIDTERRQLQYTNAGHNLPILVRADGTIVRLDAGGLVLGVAADARYTQGTVAISRGDRLVLFTDGITEAESADGQEFDDDRLLQTVVSLRGETPWRMVDAIVQRVSAFTGGHFRDDATLFVAAIA